MELDDFKDAWNNLSIEAKEKQNLNLKTFDKMEKKKFQLKLKKIILPEILGSIVCIGSAIFIAINFNRLNNLFFQITGVISILLFIILPALSFMSLHKLYQTPDVSKSYTETLKEFAVQRIKFFKLQKVNFFLCYLLLVTVILLLTKLFGKNSITDNKNFYVFTFSFSFLFLLIFSKIVSKYYNKTILQTENFLKELS